MDLEILQQLQQLYSLWQTKEQLGTLHMTLQQLHWTTPDQTTVDLKPIIEQPTKLVKLSLDGLSQKTQVYFDLGKSLQTDKKTQKKYSKAKVKTAQRVYKFYTFIGEDQIGLHPTLTPSYLYRLSNTQFNALMLDKLAFTFGGPQVGEVDNLSSEIHITPD